MEPEEFYDDQGNFDLGGYLNRVREHSDPMRNEEELVSAARNGDKKARGRLVVSYAWLAAELGLRLAPNSMQPLEAISQADSVLLKLVTDGKDKLAARLGPAIEEHFASLS